MKTKNTFFYNTLEAKNSAYRKLRNYEDENDTYQALQNKVIQQADREATLTALKMAKLKELQDEFKKQKEEQEMLKTQAKESVKNKLQQEVVESKLNELVKDVENSAFKREFNIDKAKKLPLLKRAIELGGIVDINQLKITRDKDGNIINIEDPKRRYSVPQLKTKLRNHKNAVILNIPSDAKKRGRPNKNKVYDLVEIYESKQKK